MSACSAACTAPSTWPRLDAGAVERRRAGPCTSTRASTSVARREVERHDLDHLVGRRSACAGTRRGRVRTSTAPRCTVAVADRHATRSVVDDRDVGLGRAVCVYSSASSYGSSTATWSLGVELGRRGTAGPGAGRPRRGARRGTRARRRRCRSCARSSASTSWYSTDEPVRSPTPRRGRLLARPSTCAPPRGLSRSACTSSRTASSRPSPNQRSSSGASGSSCAAHATCAREHERVLRVHDRAPRPGGSSSSPGCAAYHWSSWSSPATSTAAARRPVRPARPDLLPHRRERAGEAVEHDRVEAADVDAELERVRGRDAEQRAARELALELAPLRRRGSRRGTRRPRSRELGRDVGERAARVLRDELGAAAAAGERERLVPGAHEARRAARRSRRWPTRARPECASSSGRCQHAKHALGLRRAVVVDRLDREPAERATRARPGCRSSRSRSRTSGRTP